MKLSDIKPKAKLRHARWGYVEVVNVGKDTVRIRKANGQSTNASPELLSPVDSAG